MEMEKWGSEDPQNQNPNPYSDSNQTRGSKGKACKGHLYYSSVQKSRLEGPICIGLSKTLQQVPSKIVEEAERKKEGLSLFAFFYSCYGYSVYLDKHYSSSNAQNKKAELPYCVGFEVLLHDVPLEHAPARIHKNEEYAHSLPQPRTYKPAHSAGAGYLDRFKRNAGVVAAGVVKNVNRVCNHIKESLDDSRRPK